MWVEYRKLNDDIIEEKEYTEKDIEEIKFYNSILLDKYPYFFKYRYKDCKKKYDKYVDSNESACKQKFKMSLNSLISLSKKTPEQIEFLDNYYRYMPVTMSNSPMNILCRYIEGVNFEISTKIKEDTTQDILPLIKFDAEYSDNEYQVVSDMISDWLVNYRETEKQNDDSEKNEKTVVDYSKIATDIILQVKNVGKAVNCAIDYFYIYNPSKNKDVLWQMFGRHITANIRRNVNTVKFPMPDKNGDIKYLGEMYSMQEVDI